MTSKFKFGERIKLIGRITRSSKPGNKRYWYREGLSNQLPAIFLKHCTLWNGQAEYDPDDGSNFTGEEHIKGAWICIEGRKPEKVFLSDCLKVKQVTFSVWGGFDGWSAG